MLCLIARALPEKKTTKIVRKKTHVRSVSIQNYELLLMIVLIGAPNNCLWFNTIDIYIYII